MPPRAYKITSFDKSLEDIAARFHVPDARVLLEANQDQFPTGGEDITTMPPRLVGEVIQVPLPDDSANAWDWGTYVANGGESLTAVCAKMNKDPRIDPRRRGKGIASPPWLTPAYLLNLFENADVRGAHGGDPASVRLAPQEKVATPFPRVASGSRVIRTTPDLPTTFQVDPAWLVELISLSESIRLRARRFEEQIVALRAFQRTGLEEVGRLTGMQGVLAILREHPAKPKELLTAEMAKLGSVQRALDSLHDTAMDKLYTHLLEAERRYALDGALALGRSILATIRSESEHPDQAGADFFELAKTLRKHAVRYPLRVNELCASVGYAIQALADSPLESEIGKDVEAAVKFVAGCKPVDAKALAQTDRELADAVQKIKPGPEPANALGVLASLIRNVGGAVTSSVGNLPGPSTLAVALFRIQALRAAYKVLAAGVKVTTIEVNVELSTMIAFARNAFAEDDAAGEEIIMAIAETRASVRASTAVRGANAAESRAAIFAGDELAKGSYMASPAWTGGMTIIGLFALAFSITDMVKTGVNRTDAMGAIGGATTSALGIAQLFKLVGPKALTNAGRLVAVVGFGLSVYQWRRDAAEGKDTKGDAAATIGSALLFASFAPEPFAPVLAAAGGALLIGSFVYSLVQDDAVRNLFRTKTKLWFLGQVRTFRCGAHYKTQASALEAKTTKLENATLDADFFYVDDSQRDILSKLVESPAEVDMLLGP